MPTTDPSLNKNTKTILNTVFFLTLGVVLLTWTIGNVGIDTIFDNIKQAKLEYIVLSLLCGILSHFIRALRWNLLLEPMGYKARIWGSFHAVILGYLVNLGVPRLGEVTRPAALSKLENIPFNKLVGTVVIERVIDLVITLLIGISIVFIQIDFISDTLNNLFGDADTNTLWIYGGIAAIGIIGFIIFYKFRFKIYQLAIFKKLKDFIEGLLEGLRSVFQLKRKGLFILYSVLIWVMYFFMPYFVLFALPGTEHLGVSAGLTVLLFGTIAMIIPIPGGFGTFHTIVPVALAIYSISEEIGKSYAVLTHAIQVLVVLSVGIVSVIYFAYHSQQRKKYGMAE